MSTIGKQFMLAAAFALAAASQANGPRQRTNGTPVTVGVGPKLTKAEKKAHKKARQRGRK